MQMKLALPIFLVLAASCCAQHTVTLSWQLSPDQTLRQNIYRQNGCTGAFVKRAQVSNTTVEWTDTETDGIKNGKTYCYYVTATYSDKVLSGPSNIAEVTIPEE